MSDRHSKYPAQLESRGLLAFATMTALLAGASCTENLPSGPNTFAAHLAIVVPHDTFVVGDRSDAQAQATDDAGHVIQGLSFSWKTADSTILGFVPLGSDTSARMRTYIGRKTGPSVVRLSLLDPRFVATPVTRTEVVVVGGVKVFSSRDSTLTAVNDTGVAVAMGLVHVNGTLAANPAQGIRWTHVGIHTSTVGTGDTIRYIARSNGADTLIASHDFCLAGAKCADTIVVHVSQQLTLTLSAHSFQAWSFGDSVGPTVTLADRRGNGLAGTSVRFVPATVADSAVTLVVPGTTASNPATGLLTAPRLVAIGNGPSHVGVFGIGVDGLTVVASDSVSVVVRQVARRVAIEPLRAVMTAGDSIPFRPIARDARGATIADATIAAAAVGLTLHDVWAGPTGFFGPSTALIIPTLTGSSQPSANPAAPQIPVFIDTAQITTIKPDTAIAGATQRFVTTTVLDSLAHFAVGKFVFYDSPSGNPPDPVKVDVNGTATASWTPPDLAGNYTLTGRRETSTPLNTLSDSLGKIVLRQTTTVIADVPSPFMSTLAMGNTTLVNTTGTTVVTITVKDRFGNIVKTAKPTDFTLTSGAGGGTFGAVTCTLGVCATTYTAPAAAGTDTVSVKIAGVDILFSPMTVTIT